MQTVDTFSKALLSVQSDEKALKRLLSEQRGLVAEWLEHAHRELRSTFARQDAGRAREQGALLGVVLRARPADPLGGPFDEAFQLLLVALESSQLGDVQTALPLLERVALSPEVSASLRWLGRLGLALARAQLDDAERAEPALLEAQRLARALDPVAQALTDCHLAEFEARQGRAPAARERLRQALALVEAEGDRGGMALAWLVEARILAAEELQGEEVYENTASVAAAQRAAMADPRWPQPALFLARAAMTNGDLDEAEKRLRSIPASATVRTWLGLVARARRAAIPPFIAAEYMALHGQPATRARVEQYEVLIGLTPELLRLREALAWTLLQLGDLDAAERHLLALLSEALDGDLHTATVAALACVQVARRRSDALVAEQVGALEAWTIDWAARGCRRSRGASASRREGAGLRPAVDEGATTKPTTETPVLPATLLAAARSQTSELEFARSSAGLPAITDFAGHERTQDDPAVFSGDLATLNALQLLEFFRTTKRTGALLINADCGNGVLRLADGRLLAARASGCSSVVELLLADGKLTHEQLETARAQPRTAERGTIGTTLLALGYVTEAVLTEVLNRQLRQAIRVMLTWNKGRFAFRPHVEWVLRVEGHVAIDTQEVLFDLALEGPAPE
ncbi:MAG: DUF4388 domain-containing protein [Proteobacteria bacterium]|nr:DUF4388 domain-containing protein [Pseudomonadota bacterium]